MQELSTFELGNIALPISFVETEIICLGVTCHIYVFVEDNSKDLGIIHIDPGCKTPLQKVVQGTKTIEGYVSGKGSLTITKINGEILVHNMCGEPFSVDVQIGEIMQWEASEGSNLVAYEICYPPYLDGRFEDLHE